MNKKLHLTIHKNNKLDGIVSISTSSLLNEFCNKAGDRDKKRSERDKKSICHFCYSEKNEKIYPSLEKKLIANSKLLSETTIDKMYINASFVRFSSFGEIINEKHMENLYNIAKNNKHTKFCLLTKRYDIVMQFPKLNNIIYIASSPLLNTPIKNKTVLDYFDKVFTVYEKEKTEGVKINCGVSGGCMTCKLCYHRKGSKQINEILRK